jgi:hypothetical protein
MAVSSPLVLKFSTDLAGAQKSIANFAASVVSNMISIGTKVIETKKTLDLLNQIQPLKLAIGGFIGFEALKTSIDLVTQAAEAAAAEMQRLIDIGSQSKNAGVGTTFFQGWTQQAKELNLETSDLVGMLEKARQAATETIGEGKLGPTSPGRDRIEQNVLAGNLGSAALGSYDNAGSQENRIRVVLGLIDQLQQKGAQLAAFDLAGKFFGTTFETQLRNGVDMIGRMRAALDGLQSAGSERIVPQSEIENAQRMQAELDAINNRLANGLKPILDDIHAWQQNELEGMIQLKSDWVSLVEIAGQLWRWCDRIAVTISSWGNAGIFVQLRDLLDKWGLIDHSMILPGPPEGTGASGDTGPALTVHGRGQRDTSRSLPSLHPAAPKERSGSETDQVETYINSLKKQTAAEEAEAQTLGLGNKARQEAVDLAKAQEAAAQRGTPLTAAETAEVLKQADAYVAAKEKIDTFNKGQEDARAQAQFFGAAFEGSVEKILVSGDRLGDVMRSLAQSLEQAALKALLLGEGPLASLFGTAPASGATGADSVGGMFGMFAKGAGALFNGGPNSLFSGFHAAGGTIPAGHWGIAGEAGAEIINGPATVTPVAQINAALSAGRAGFGGGNDNSRTFNIDARGAQAGVADQIAAALKSYDNHLNRNLPQKMAMADRRYG